MLIIELVVWETGQVYLHCTHIKHVSLLVQMEGAIVELAAAKLVAHI